MKISLNKATLIKRYKRFLADIILADGSTTTIHVANTGAMSGCAEPGDIVWYSTSDNPKRKYPFSWEYTQKPNGQLICVNTIRANQFVEQALLAKSLPALTDFDELKREVKYGNENSKIDFLLTQEDQADTYIEVKSVTLLQDQLGYFPDAVSTRGQKHLRELMEISEQGKRAVLLFAVLHSGINSVQAAAHIDKKYAELLTQAKQAGVEIFAYKANFTYAKNSITAQLSESLAVII
ncbi:MAG: DNA/RNA nuclease SfsA [Thalassotalea sp.]